MKTTTCLLMLCLWLTATVCMADSRTIQGNGKVVTTTIPITAYDEISLVGHLEFEYVQSDAAPYLELTIDENLVAYVVVEVKGHTLSIYPQQDKEGRRSYQLRPTRFKVKSNSKTLKDCSLAGSAILSVVSPLKIEKLEASVAGSGEIHFDKQLSGRKAAFSVAGSGEIKAADIQTDNLECSVAGSGEMNLKGEVPRVSYSVAGSGELHGFDCKAKNAECSVAGSGTIEVYAVDHLDASVASSGEIRYRGNPSLSKSVVGSGSIKRD